MSLNELKSWLESVGFKCANNPLRSMSNDCHWYAYRRSALPARECEANEGKGCQLVVYPHSMHFQNQFRESIEVEVCGEANGIWWNLQAYNIKPVELRERLGEIEAGLVSAWNSLKKEEEKQAA